jgi:DNA polymerase-3 subunit beta
MKLTIDRNTFLKGLSHGQGVVERRTTMPILSHILLKAAGEELQLTSTDLEFSIVEKIPASIKQEGQITVSAHMLYDIVRKLSDGAEISLAFDPNTSQMIICSGPSNFKLPSLPAEDFPVITSNELPYNFVLPAAQLRYLIERTRFAMSTEETRYFLNGIYLHVSSDQHLRAVATDGHRLAQVSVPLPQGAEAMPGIIISRKTVTELLKLIADTQEDIQISISETQIAVTIQNAYVTSRLIDGTYPDYAAAIPKANDKMVQLRMKMFSEAVDRVATVSVGRLAGVRLSIDEGALILTAANEESGAAREEIAVDYNNAPIDIGFNARYLLDVANQIETEEAQFWFADSTSPILIRPTNDDSSLYVLMPMRV